MPNPATSGSACINAKERRAKKRKGTEAQRVKPFIPSQAIDARIGDEEQNRYQKKEQKDRGSGTPTHLP